MGESLARPGVLLRFHGELDVAGARVLRARLERAISGGARGVVVDLIDVTFIDSLSLAALAAAKHRLGPTGRLAIVAENEFVLLMLAATGLDGVLDTFAEREAAREFARV